MRKTFLFSTLILLMVACKKDKFTSTPQIKFKSVNTNELHRGETLQFTLSFTDAEGDLNDKIFIQKIIRPCVGSPAGGFIDSSYSVPQFPSTHNQAGEILITYDYNSLNPECAPKNDTAIFKFVVRDNAKHVSDTAVSSAIIIFN